MSDNRLQSFFYGAGLALMVGWVLYIGRLVFVPIVFSVLVAYIIVGLVRALERVPRIGPRLPVELRYLLSILGIGGVLAAGVSLVISNIGKVVQLAPRYQDSLLDRIQQVAAFLGVETAPTWTVLRQHLLEPIRLQDLVGSTVMSVTGIMTMLLIVFLYVTFLLIEQRFFRHKLDNLSSDPGDVARVRQVISRINARIGQYLGVKTFINIVLGVISWAVMAVLGVEFAAFWAVLIAVLNYVPYIGSFLGVLFPVAWGIVQFGDPGTVITLLVLLSAAQFVIGNFLDPFLMGKSLNLSPFVILASLTIWGGLWGIPGAFLAVPVTAVLVIVFSEFDATRPIAVMMSRNGRLAGNGPSPIVTAARAAQDKQ
ncbi:AI-2E family transporter [Pseudoxanthomonas wuyuanensis]